MKFNEKIKFYIKAENIEANDRGCRFQIEIALENSAELIIRRDVVNDFFSFKQKEDLRRFLHGQIDEIFKQLPE